VNIGASLNYLKVDGLDFCDNLDSDKVMDFDSSSTKSKLRVMM
jgi:hypothetical protein